MIEFILSVLICGVVNIIIVTGALRALVNIVLGAAIPAARYNRWVSNIPGNPTSLDHLLAAFFGPFPEMNDFNSVLTQIPFNQGPVLLHGFPPRCRYWSFQVFLPGAKTNSPKQCLRDTEVTLGPDGSYTVVLAMVAKKPKWPGMNWIEIPDGTTKGILCLRCYCPRSGEAFKAPDVWFAASAAVQGAASAAACVVAAGSHLGSPERLGDSVRVPGMFPAQVGVGAPHRRLALAVVLNAALLAASALPGSPLPGLTAGGACAPLSLGLSLPLGALVGVALHWLAWRYVRRVYRRTPLFQGLTPNTTVLVPDPKGDLKGHPNHLYYTLPYDATTRDVKVQGVRRGAFTYTSVHAYGWSSLPPPNGQFKYDDTLWPDDCAPLVDDLRMSNMGSSRSRLDDRFTVYLTTQPTFRPRVNEIDVSEEPTGVCVIRMIYPESQAEVERCTPTIRAINRGAR
jgi:hypothetical protein